jgi:flagellar biosynthetic protein FlhB
VAEGSSEERTEAPSDKKRQEAREKGTVAKSTEVNSVLVLLSAVIMLKLTGSWMQNEISSLLERFIIHSCKVEMSVSEVVHICTEAAFIFFKCTLPVAGTILMVGVIANIIQVGFLFTLKPIIPNFEKINPVSGFQRLFSMRSLVELIKNLLKLTIISLVAWFTIKAAFDEMVMLADASIMVIWGFILSTSFDIVIRISVVLIIIAILDYVWQKFEHEKQMKMTKQEVKEERKQMDGDPLVKSRIRSLQREMARRRMMEQVPKATVVVTNPTYIAIAIRYEPKENDTPIVVAKGKRLIAAKIKQTAIENHVPIVEDKPLARAMYDRVVEGSSIPVEFFTAVAEILAYVFRLKRNRSAA